MYEIKKGKSFYASLTALKYTLTIPKSNKMPYLNIFRVIFTFIRMLGVILFLILPSIHLIKTVKDGKGLDISENFSTIFGSLGAIVSNVLFLVHYGKWTKFFIDLENFKKHGTHADFENTKRRLNFYSSIYTLYTIVAVIIYAIVAATQTTYCREFNEHHGTNEICGIFSPVFLPFDGNRSYIRATIFYTQASLAMFTFPTAAMICYVPYEGVVTIGSYISLLKENLIEAFNITDETERRNKLRFCIYYHNCVLSLCEREGQLNKYTSGFLCMTCAIVLGCIGNLILKAKPLPGVCYFVGYVTALILLCHGGQKMIDETLSVGDALYNSKWYEADAKTMKDVLFILARSQKAAQMDSLPLGAMNYTLFVMILKTSYSYLALLSRT